ncbi:hypothetical protein [Pseudomonas uvaldensis]|uniref:hypothetical protein n=1 Tax=Pseudomonas uvaldensis TaxID=2878385 RepID=UPI001E4BFF24|nr:hypothetical protein [Pseudomonas uvaldensis]MCE0461987.1 hypothetical protein [Pseudomonas uvaldensis]
MNTSWSARTTDSAVGILSVIGTTLTVTWFESAPVAPLHWMAKNVNVLDPLGMSNAVFQLPLLSIVASPREE